MEVSGTSAQGRVELGGLLRLHSRVTTLFPANIWILLLTDE
jgi:hypothetical protein